MVQESGTRGGTFHGEMDRCRESQGWTTARSSIPECDGKDQGFLYHPGVWFADAMPSFSGVTFVFKEISERT